MPQLNELLGKGEALKELRELPEKTQTLRDEIVVLFKNLEQNPDITPAGAGCFTMNLSNLSPSGNLSPSHYDFKVQYEALERILRLTPLFNLDKRIKEIISTGKIVRPHNDVLILHPKVVEKIKEIWLTDSN